MALTIPENFKNDIQSNHPNIYPFVVIHHDGLNIRISTNAITIGNDFHKPLLLNVPSLKESIDLETRKYNINSVTLDFSNVKYEGKKLSDEIAEKFGSLMNTTVLVKWGSPSTTDYDTGFTVYNGTVRRYTHTDDKVRIELEDKDEQLGAEILLNAIEKPFVQILKNVGIEKYHSILSYCEKGNEGYNIKTGEYVDMVKEGIIDPTKVTRTALENAVSVAGTMLITECTVVDDPEEEKTEVSPMMGM